MNRPQRPFKERLYKTASLQIFPSHTAKLPSRDMRKSTLSRALASAKGGKSAEIGVSDFIPEWRRERVWNPTLFCGCRSFCKEILNLWTCDRARTFVRPVCAADIGTAGRYGDARTGSKSPTASSKLRESSWFFLPGSFRSFAHAFRYFLTTLRSSALFTQAITFATGS